MKKIALVGAVLAMAFVTASASAANSLVAGTVGLGVSVNPSSPLISGKYFFAKDIAILGGFGFKSADTKTTDVQRTVATTDTSSTPTQVLLGGVRKYFKTDDFAPFIGGVVQYTTIGGVTQRSTTTVTNPAVLSITKDWLLAAEAGAEYFIGKQFSVEGKVQLGYVSKKVVSGDRVDTSEDLGTSTAGLGFNFYF